MNDDEKPDLDSIMGQHVNGLLWAMTQTDMDTIIVDGVLPDGTATCVIASLNPHVIEAIGKIKAMMEQDERLLDVVEVDAHGVPIKTH